MLFPLIFNYAQMSYWIFRSTVHYQYFPFLILHSYRMAYIIFIVIHLRTKAVIRQYFETHCTFRKPSYCAHIYNRFFHCLLYST